MTTEVSCNLTYKIPNELSELHAWQDQESQGRDTLPIESEEQGRWYWKEDWEETNAQPDRIPWDSYFLGLAHLASRRSIDGQTKHGCLLVDQHKHIIGVGYNSHGRDLPSSLPRHRPEKYPWMIHSEENAIINCTISPFMIPGGLTAYITGHPCFHCAYLLRQAHVKKVIYSGTKRWLKPAEGEAKLFEELLSAGDFTIEQVKPDLNWLFNYEFIDSLKEMGFVN